jgi:ribosomal protein S27E
MSDDDKVKRLPVRFKQEIAEDDKFLVIDFKKCLHNRFYVNEAEAEVTCRDCNEKLNPIWVLVRMARQETIYHEAHRRYLDEMERLKERSRTKCTNCGHMTEISRPRRGWRRSRR